MRKLFTVPLILLTLTNGCQKKVTDNPDSESSLKEISGHVSKVTLNPFSLRNMQTAMATITSRKDFAKRTVISGTYSGLPNNYPVYKYFKFNPNNFDSQQLESIEKDSGITLMNFPFADISIYNDNYILDSAKLAQLNDGYIYGIALATDTTANNLILRTNASIIDSLVLPSDSDTALIFQAMRQAGYNIIIEGDTTYTRRTMQPDFLGIHVCLFKQPHGTVRYRDNDLGRLEPVRGIQVWALVLGIPVSSYTNADGNYSIPYRFSIGTIMGTKAKNARVNIKPLDTHANNLISEVGTLIENFIVGSVHVEGWFSSCTLKNNYDFNFNTHSQVRYWSQILNAYYFHDLYCMQEGIKNAPNDMVCYAQWGINQGNDPLGNPEIGSAGTPMLGHISLTTVYIEKLINNIFGGNVNLTTDSPNLFNVLTGLLPDMTFRIPQTAEPSHYSSRLAQTAFHELGHASMYRQVGGAWHAQLDIDELNTYSGTNPYGDGTQNDYQRVSLAESWAQFIGTNFAIRRYPTGFMESSGGSPFFTSTLEYPMTMLLEDEGYFFGSNVIPYGIFNDFIDAYNPTEEWDNFSGETIEQMYNTFRPEITTWCGWESEFFQNTFNQINPGIPMQIFNHYNNPTVNNFNCGITIYYNDSKSGTYTKTCPSCNTGSLVTYSVPQNAYSSFSSKEVANALAQNDVDANGQLYADTHGTCTPSSINDKSYSTTFSITNLTSMSFTMSTGFSTGVSFDLSLDGGTTYATSGITSSPYVVTGLIPNTNYQVVRRMHGLCGGTEVILPPTSVTTLTNTGDGSYSNSFGVSNITSTSFTMSTGFSPGVTFDLSFDGGLTYSTTGITLATYTVTGLNPNTTYQVVRRMHGTSGAIQVILPPTQVKTLP